MDSSPRPKLRFLYSDGVINPMKLEPGQMERFSISFRDNRETS